MSRGEGVEGFEVVFEIPHDIRKKRGQNIFTHLCDVLQRAPS